MANRVNTLQTVEPTRAAIYVRVSTDDQASEGYGLDVQFERCRAQIVVKGWTNAGEYQDAGISGTKDASQRPGLAAVLEAAHNGEIDAVIVLALDRLGRNTRLVLELVETFAGLGVDIVSCKESLDTSTPQGKFVLTMFAALAQLERDTIIGRTTDGRNERGRRDGNRGGRVPMGYIRLVDGTVEIVEKDAALVRYIFSLRNSDVKLRAIANCLNAEGYLTSRGKQWHASSVLEVLKNEHEYRGGNYRGIVTKQVSPEVKTRVETGEVIESEWQWPAILAA